MMGMAMKNVLIIAPESWGKSKVSKHHYALAFADKGFQVYFLNLNIGSSGKPDRACEDHKNITLSYISLPFYLDKLRFHSRLLYNLLLKFKINKWTRTHPKLDYVVSFDCNGAFTDLSRFNAKRTIFFPVDQVNEKFRKEYRGFDRLISISPVILKAFPAEKKKLLVHHGLSPQFLDKNYQYKKLKMPKKIAYVGNLLIGPILDKSVLKKIISSHLNLEFHFYGVYQKEKSNLGSDLSKETLDFIEFLETSKNCILHGAISPKQLSLAYEQMDLFLVIYNYKYDKNQCSNSHKIMEYLSTGKPIISTRLSMFDNLNLFSMLETFDNSQYLNFFTDQLRQWKTISSFEMYEKRKSFVADKSY